ncbi:AAA family ATPase [Streptacidiphilus sp. ASG 303]|uniref:bifunctional aminoglycoside phosphotransferase/ATP-binding protein n=1 Tax=Streptacidiphilus sp. ASG 303 TaxID=2896847 RepID=UPI001E59CC68|nr:AAA family ATPase [Streptacidiphilus sp. ASG 303]MCD0485962.1 AAA family ATPase [Streptacidiphilus sp. ASG 303]
MWRAAAHETHTAVVFFAADRAYKVKKPVDLGFLDFTTPAARRAACEREVALNRRFAPDVYLGLGELSPPGGGPPEPLVVMRRMPEDRRLAHLVRTGAPVDDHLRRVARLLARCHADAPRGPDVDREGTAGALLGRWEANLAQLDDLGPEPSLKDTAAEAGRLVRRYLSGRGALFERRIREGRVVDGHGDLLAQDVFCLDDGPRVLDCLEFDDRLRYVDGLDDAAFLAMDLERLGAPAAAAFLLERYGEYSGDPAPPSLWHHYVAYRAFVRCKVALVRAGQGDPGGAAEAYGLAGAGLRHLRTSAVSLVLVGGLPGSGKSTLSGALADRLGLTLLSSDRLRKELAGLPPDRPAPAAWGEGLYTPERTRLTYDALLERAAALLAQGESVVLDATWTTRERREAAAETARRACADLAELRCEVPRELAEARLGGRPAGASDADAAVAGELAARADPWPRASAVDTGGSLDAAVSRAVAVVRPYGTGQAPPFRRPFMEPD